MFQFRFCFQITDGIKAAAVEAVRGVDLIRAVGARPAAALGAAVLAVVLEFM